MVRAAGLVRQRQGMSAITRAKLSPRAQAAAIASSASALAE